MSQPEPWRFDPDPDLVARLRLDASADPWADFCGAYTAVGHEVRFDPEAAT